MNPVGSTRKH